MSLGGVTLQGSSAIALISVENRTQEAFIAGQEVANGVTLRAIYADHVVLKYGNAFKILRLEGRARALAAANDVAPAQTDKDPLLHPELIRSDASGNSDDFLREVRVSQHYAGGYLVEVVQPDSIYERLGLLPGDVVYSLDTLTLVKLEEMSGSSALSGAQDIRLEVVRNGERVPLRYALESQE